MRTPLSSGLAAASLGLLVAGLAFRSWQVVLLALPPVIVLALGSLFPPVRPRLVRTGFFPTAGRRDGLLGRPRVYRGRRGSPDQLEGVRSARPPLYERVRGGAVRRRRDRGRRTPRIVHRHGDR